MLKWSAYKVCACNSWKQMYFEIVTATEVRCIYSFFSYNKETRPADCVMCNRTVVIIPTIKIKFSKNSHSQSSVDKCDHISV